MRTSVRPSCAATENGQQGQDYLVYAARISLDQRELKTEDRVVDLGPGMAVTVEVKTGSRRIIGYLLSPLARYEMRLCENDRKHCVDAARESRRKSLCSSELLRPGGPSLNRR
ncbi:hypothetical protein ACVIWV_001032 [Bradyrhizobium diazoefficiens]